MDEFGMNEAVAQFISALRTSDIFEEYTIQRDKIRQIPELKDKIDNFRRRSFELQANTAPEDLFDKQELLEQEYEELQRNPIAGDFLEAEVAFCRMMQEINKEIIEAIDFD